MIDVARLSLNQATVKRLTLPETVDACARHDIGGIGLWRDRVAEVGAAEARAAVHRAGLHVTSLCRGGFLTHADPLARAAAIADNRAAIEDAATLQADVLVLVSGGLPGGSRDLPAARRAIADAIGELVPRAAELGVRLGIEALHPMFCADRCAISTLGQALELAQQFPAATVGVVVDSYHVWWDPDLLEVIARAGDRIASYQVCDWLVPLPADMLLGRGQLGDGHIDFGPMSDAVVAAGYDGFVEVEIFNQQIWDADPDDTIATTRKRFVDLLSQPHPFFRGMTT
jgi:sugar phosphate isomerase/epimerase